MDVSFDPIILRYQGKDADQDVIELGQLGRSIQGASRLLGAAGNIVTTGEYVKRSPALSLRVLAGVPKRGTYELPAITMTVTRISPGVCFFEEAIKGSDKGDRINCELRHIQACGEEV